MHQSYVFAFWLLLQCYIWLVVSTPVKNTSQLESLFPIYGKKTCSKPQNQILNVFVFFWVSTLSSCEILYLNSVEQFFLETEIGLPEMVYLKNLMVDHPPPICSILK